MSFRSLIENKANKDTQEFINFMLDDGSFFTYINDNIYDGSPDFVKRKEKEIKKFWEVVYDWKMPFDLKKVQSDYVFVQLELGGTEKVNFKKDYTGAL
jgi:hypothetical protein